MPKRSKPPRRKRTRIVPIAVLAGAVAGSAAVAPACEDGGGPADMRTYPLDVTAHGFFDFARPRDLEPDDGGSSD